MDGHRCTLSAWCSENPIYEDNNYLAAEVYLKRKLEGGSIDDVITYLLKHVATKPLIQKYEAFVTRQKLNIAENEVPNGENV
ncbi:unnamed protein product [Cyprideis torosa]|uniref:Uncharacterized protein n=1 Tax=Cyprideis torosa TaxID=163714 RepID=A0A7R8WWJ5_9CRUS|nr:unnamed protein product [Cyprideis torosa]CAG0908486.1 unnamed protein product [Cyprideis torosa]